VNIKINDNYRDPNNNDLEIIERKGMGHPDTLADKLAEECSRAYSNYCMKHFGCVLHHNFDKLYIGAGCFRYENGKTNMYSKVKVVLNGRASNTMNGEKINIDSVLIPVIKKYLNSVMPRLDVDNEVDIIVNCSQNTQVKNWFTPQDINDVPDAINVFANDTSLCVSHYPPTYSEKLALEIEQYFWEYIDYYPTPKFNEIGQDIKVMVSRIDKDITVTICMPVYPDCYNSREEYIEIVKKHEKDIYVMISKFENVDNYNVKIEINRIANGDYRVYSLIKGSCIECGEEGVVGRGNNSQGLISSFRQHTMEAPSGKNERYHTGRVMSFLSENSVKRIANECNLKVTMYALTRNKMSLLDPFLSYISVDKKIDKNTEEKIHKILEEEFEETQYLSKILSKRKMI